MRALLLTSTAALALAGCRGTPPTGEAAAGVRELRVRISGNENYGDGRLLEVLADELRDAARRGPSKAAIDDCAWTLEEFYRTRGYPDVRVSYEYTGAVDGAALGKLLVDEGTQCLVEAITIGGNHFRTSSDLAGFFEGERAGPFGSGLLLFDEGHLSSAVRALGNYYYAEGFLTVAVDEPFITYNEDRTRARVEVTMREGPRHHLRELSFAGELGLTDATFAAIREEHKGDPYTPRTPYEVRSKLVAAYGNAGYPDAEIRFASEVDAKTGAVALAFNLDCGTPVTLSGVEITGNATTREGFVRSRLAFAAGEPYHAGKLHESFRSLYRTGLFETVDIALESGAGAARAVQVRLEEAPTLELFVEPGYGSYEGVRLRAGAIEKNLFGMGRTLSLESTVGALDKRAELGLIDPWLFGESLTGTTSISAGEREEPSFTLTEIGTHIGVSRQFGPRWEGSVSYQFRATELDDIDVTDGLAMEALEDVDISSIALSAGRDTRDSRLVPGKGSTGRGTLEWAASALGSDLDFLRFDFQQAVFLHLREGSVLGLSVRTGAIVPIATSSVIPLQERYFNGGENSVRSFGESQLGPTDADGDPLGGETYSLFTAELREHLTGNLFGAAFVDAGNVSADHSDYFRFEGFRSGIGLGLRYMLPIGPLRLDGAVNPDARPHEDDYAIHLSVGMSF